MVHGDRGLRIAGLARATPKEKRIRRHQVTENKGIK